MKTGRPTSYELDYCEQVIELGRAGKSKAQMAAHFDVSRQTIDNWAIEHEEFLEALTRAVTHAQAWWEDAAQTGYAGETINPMVWSKSVQARFREDYTERKEVTGKDGGPIATDTTHHGEIAISDTSAFIAEAIGDGTTPAHTESGED